MPISVLLPMEWGKSLADPLGRGFLGFAAALILFLAMIGVAWGIARRDRRLVRMAIPLLASEAVLVVVDLLDALSPGGHRPVLGMAGYAISLTAFALLALLTARTVSRLRGVRGPAALIAILAFAFALMACGVLAIYLGPRTHFTI